MAKAQSVESRHSLRRIPYSIIYVLKNSQGILIIRRAVSSHCAEMDVRDRQCKTSMRTEFFIVHKLL